MNPQSEEELIRQINNLSQRVYTLEQQVSSLQNKPMENRPLENKPMENQPLENKPIGNNQTQTANSPISSVPNVAQPYYSKQVTTRVERTKNNQTMESKIGKNVMAIVASALILFSLILFGGLIMSYITNEVRYVIMLALSLAFTAVGVKFMNKESKFYGLFSSIAAVGVCGFYISQLIAFFGFKLFDEIILMVLILIWLAGTIVLAKLKSNMFYYVSNVGLAISALLATIEWPDAYLGISIYFIGLIVLYILNKTDDYNRDCFIFLQIPVMTGLFMIVYHEGWHLIVFAILLVALFIASQFLYKYENKFEVLMLAQMLLTSLALFIDALALWLTTTNVKEDTLSNASLLLFTLCMIIIAVLIRVIRFNDGKRLLYFSHYIMIASLLCLQSISVYSNYVGFIDIAIVLIAIGHIKNDQHFKYPGLGYLFLAIMVPPKALGSFAYIIFLLIIGTVFVLTYMNYHMEDKYINVGLLFYTIFSFIMQYTSAINITVLYFIFAAICFYINSKLFTKNLKENKDEPTSIALGYIMAGIMLLWSIVILSTDNIVKINDTQVIDTGITFILTALVALGLCVMNCKKTLTYKELPQMLTGCYICFKFTLFLILVLVRFSVASLALTICVCLFAIACIVVGSIKRYKPFRIYGLILTLLSVFKLVVFDIKYDSDIMRPLGFLIAGLLCFGISWIYTMLEKKQDEIDNKGSK